MTGAKKHIGFEATIMMDFSNFFDTIFRNKFDQNIFNSLDINDEYLFHKDGYTAQGFPSSPTLCNIALIDFVKDLKEWLKTRFGRDNFALVLYADDISISYNKISKVKDYKTRRSEEWKEIRDFVTDLSIKYELKINKQKTRVRFAKYGYRRILGINVGDTDIRATRSIVKKIRKNEYKRDSGDSHAGLVLGGLRTWSRMILPGGISLCSPVPLKNNKTEGLTSEN